MRRNSIALLIGGALIGAVFFRKRPMIAVSVHLDAAASEKYLRSSPEITVNVPAPVINMPQPPPMVVNMGPTINNEIIDYPDERFVQKDRIENEPVAEEFLLEITELIEPYMGPDRANSLRSFMRVMNDNFIEWARQLYKLPSN